MQQKGRAGAYAGNVPLNVFNSMTPPSIMLPSVWQALLADQKVFPREVKSGAYSSTGNVGCTLWSTNPSKCLKIRSLS